MLLRPQILGPFVSWADCRDLTLDRLKNDGARDGLRGCDPAILSPSQALGFFLASYQCSCHSVLTSRARWCKGKNREFHIALSFFFFPSYFSVSFHGGKSGFDTSWPGSLCQRKMSLSPMQSLYRRLSASPTSLFHTGKVKVTPVSLALIFFSWLLIFSFCWDFPIKLHF
jgi:hypothetical protein